MSRRQARELALQALFNLDINPCEPEADLQEAYARIISMAKNCTEQEYEIVHDQLLEAVKNGELDKAPAKQQLHLNSGDKSFALSIIEGTRANIEEIDEAISGLSKDWRLERMAVVDRNILRLAIFELSYADEKNDSGIVINEAIELAKRYGTDDSSRFVNGILGTYSRSINK